MSLKKHQGYGYAGASVVLVSFAQLAMKWGMTHLPQWHGWQSLRMPLAHGDLNALCWVGLGIGAYMLSFLCWLQALARIPLNKAYSLLSLSYVLVCVATAYLPWFLEPIDTLRIAGTILITVGVCLVVYHPAPTALERSDTI